MYIYIIGGFSLSLKFKEKINDFDNFMNCEHTDLTLEPGVISLHFCISNNT